MWRIKKIKATEQFCLNADLLKNILLVEGLSRYSIDTNPSPEAPYPSLLCLHMTEARSFPSPWGNQNFEWTMDLGDLFDLELKVVKEQGGEI